MTQKVTQGEATLVLNSVKKKHAAWIESSNTYPVLTQGNLVGLEEDNDWAVEWEDGPRGWAIQFHESTPGLKHEVYNTWAIYITSADNS